MPIDGLPGGTFEGCVRVMRGNVDDPEAFCAWKIHQLTGKWPAEEALQTAGLAPVTQVTGSLSPDEIGEGEVAGSRWLVTVIAPEQNGDLWEAGDGRIYIRSRNGNLYAEDALRESIPRWDGVKVYDNHLTDREFQERAGMRSVMREMLGVLRNPRWDADGHRLLAELVVVDEDAAKKLLRAHRLGVLDSIGLSIDVLPRQGQNRFPDGVHTTVEEIAHIVSVDVVADPAAGGRFTRLIAATQQTGRLEMNGDEVFTEEQRTALQEMITQAVTDAVLALEERLRSEGEEETAEAAERATSETTPEEVAQAIAAEVAQSVEELPPDVTPEEAAEQAAQVAADAAEVVKDELKQAEAEEELKAREALRRVRMLEARLMLRDELDRAKLPPAMRLAIEKAFEGQIPTPEQVRDVVNRAKEALARQDTTGKPRRTSAVVRASLTGEEQARIGLLQLLTQHRGGIRYLEGIKANYVRDRLPDRTLRSWHAMGRPNLAPYGGSLALWMRDLFGGRNPLSLLRARATEANALTAILTDTVNLLLAADYSLRHEWWTPIVTTVEVDTIDDVTLARLYGLPELELVEEGASYTDLPLKDAKETASYAKFGNTVSITIEELLREKAGVNLLARVPDRFADAWYNRQSSLVASVFTVNSGTGPVLSDGGALFNATALTTAGGHANLGTSALSYSAFVAARAAMRKQTSAPQGEGERLLIEPKFMLVPVDLEAEAEQIRGSEKIPGSANNDLNPFREKFEVITVPHWTDANDWALVADPLRYPAIYMVYVRGHRVPEVFTAGDEVSGTMFTNDTIKFKARLLTFRVSSTYNCAPVADFRPLYKANVA